MTLPKGLLYRPPARAVPATYAEAVKRLRRRLRLYSVHSIIDACIEVLDCWRGKGLDELKSAPWLTLLIVKLVLEDESISLHRTQPCPTSLIDELRNDLWNTPRVRERKGSPSLYLMIRSLVHTQLMFQRAESFAFLRWPALISRLPPEHELRGQFEAEFGCDPDTFIVVVFAAYSAVMQGKTFITPDYWDPLRPLYGSAIDRFLDRFAKGATDLREMLREELHRRIYTEVDGRRTLRPDAGTRPESELVEFPWVSRFPLFRHPSGRLAVWHRLVFARGMDESVHNVLSSLGQTYTDPFSKIFEGYVLELVRDSGMDFVSEKEMKGGIASRPAVEALVHADECNVFIESKMSLFPDRVLISDRGPEIFMKLRRIREGMVQGWRVGEMLRDGTVHLNGASSAAQDFLLIVTSRQLNVCSGEHFKRLFGNDVIARINPTWQVLRAWLPKFLQEGRGYSEAHALTFNSVWFIATDVGCLGAGALAVWLARRHLSVHAARVLVFAGCAVLCAACLLVPWLGQGWLLLAVLSFAGACALDVPLCAGRGHVDLSRDAGWRLANSTGRGR